MFRLRMRISLCASACCDSTARALAMPQTKPPSAICITRAAMSVVRMWFGLGFRLGGCVIACGPACQRRRHSRAQAPFTFTRAASSGRLLAPRADTGVRGQFALERLDLPLRRSLNPQPGQLFAPTKARRLG